MTGGCTLSAVVGGQNKTMTERDARKIATLRTAVVLNQDDTLVQDESLPIEDARKISDQQQEIAKTLAGRYDLEVDDLPNSTIRIVNGVLEDSL
jgi:hypothetical protein